MTDAGNGDKLNQTDGFSWQRAQDCLTDRKLLRLRTGLEAEKSWPVKQDSSRPLTITDNTKIADTAVFAGHDFNFPNLYAAETRHPGYSFTLEKNEQHKKRIPLQSGKGNPAIAKELHVKKIVRNRR